MSSVRARLASVRIKPGSAWAQASARRYARVSAMSSAGSPVIDLATGVVVGLHYAGQAATSQGSGIKYAIGSWALLKSAQLQRANLKYE